MRHKQFLRSRSSATIVQQMNCCTTRQMFLDFFSGKSVSLPSGSEQRSFDFDDQTKVDFDAPSISEADNLIEQHFMRETYMEHLHPTPPDTSDTSTVDSGSTDQTTVDSSSS